MLLHVVYVSMYIYIYIYIHIERYTHDYMYIYINTVILITPSLYVIFIYIYIYIYMSLSLSLSLYGATLLQFRKIQDCLKYIRNTSSLNFWGWGRGFLLHRYSISRYNSCITVGSSLAEIV